MNELVVHDVIYLAGTDHGQSLWWLGVIIWAVSSVITGVLFYRASLRYAKLYREILGVKLPDPRNTSDWYGLNKWGRSMGETHKAFSERQDDPRLEQARRDHHSKYWIFLSTVLGGMVLALALSEVFL